MALLVWWRLNIEIPKSVLLVATTTLLTLAFLSAPAANAADSPSTFGSGSGSRRIAPTRSEISVEKRKTVMDKKKQAVSKREAAEAKGQGMGRSMMESLQIEKKFSKQISREIATFQQVIPKLKRNAPERPEMLKRLVESYYQLSLLTFRAESRQYDQSWKKWDQAGRQGDEPVLNIDRSKKVLSQVIRRAMQMITEYPKYKNLDEVYFQVAFALESLEKSEEASSYYTQIIKKFPNSRRIADSYFALGEFHFNGNNFRNALSSYTQVLKYTRSPIYPWALYKIAWCHFNLQRYNDSLSTFKRVVAESMRASQGSATAKLQLKEQALRDMINVYVELGGRLSEAERYFASVGGKSFYWDMLLRLADQLRERGQFAKAIEVLKKYVTQDRFSIQAAEIQIDIVNIANELANKKILFGELANLLSQFRPESPWGRKNGKSPEYKDVLERIVQVGVNIPKEFHAAAQKGGNRNLALAAKEGYEIFLKYFDSHPASIEIRFLLAELEYHNGQYDNASPHFLKIASLGPKSPYFEKSGGYYVSSSYLAVEKEMVALRKSPVDVKGSPKPIAKGLQEYVQACNNYTKWFPKDSEKVKACEVDIAEIYVKHNNSGESEKRLMDIAAKYPGGKEGKTSVEMLLFMAKGDSKKLVDRSRIFAKIPEYRSDKDIGPRLREILDTAEFSEAEKIEKGGKDTEAAKKYEAFAEQNPKSQHADKALFNAGNAYKKARAADKAIENYQKLYQRYPKSAQVPEALLLIAELASNEMDLMMAAQHSERFALQFSKDKRAPAVLMETCRLYGVLNDIGRAQKACGAIMSARRSDSRDASQVLADLYYQNNQFAAYVALADSTLLKERLSPTDRMTLLNRIVEAETRMNRRSAADKRIQEMDRLYRSNRGVQGPGVARVVEIVFRKAYPVYERFRGTHLRGNSAQALMASVQEKNKALENVEAQFKQVMAMGEAQWGVASLYVMGVTNQTMANELLNPPLPPGITPEEVKILKGKFAEFAQGFLKKAQEFYSTAMMTVSKELVYTDYAQKVAAALGQMDPKRAAVADEWIPDYLFVQSQWVPVGKVGSLISKLGGK